MANALSYWVNTFPNNIATQRRKYDNIFDDFFGYSPRVSVKESNRNVKVSETESSFEIAVLAPGLKKEDINISLEGQSLIISYEKSEDNQNTFSQNSFKYSWKAPTKTSPESIRANYEAGILNVSIDKPVQEETITHSIKVD